MNDPADLALATGPASETGTPAVEGDPAPAGDPAAPAAAPASDEGHRTQPTSAAFRAFIAGDWEPRPEVLPELLEAAGWARARREALSAQFPGARLVLPAGVLRVRSNDTDYRFRAHAAFAHLSGLGAEAEPDSVLVLEPNGEGHEALLFVRPRAPRDSKEFYADARYGELWVGARPTLEEVSARTGLAARHLDELSELIGSGDLGDAGALRIVPGADPAVEDQVAATRATAGVDVEAALAADAQLRRADSELRLGKDAWEVGQLRLAVEATARGFADIVRRLPEAVATPRGERVVETAFEGRARLEGNGVGYDTIAAAGTHACTLHWIRNDGPVREGDLVLVDAGVEVDSLYTADVTRTIPVSGRFSPEQAEVYQAVLDAADAAFAVARPGVLFREVHQAAMRVIAQRVHDWGWLPGSVEESLDPEGQFHRRWMVHGTSHHLGIDVHDCAQARRDMYLDAPLRPGMVFTIEPGLYLQPDDLLVPPAWRGIGVRIEDDVLVTDDGVENLSAMLPRTVAGIEEWMASLRG
ncbi:MAG: aminopeptidase P family protein [Kineosporiaceae bacterium]